MIRFFSGLALTLAFCASAFSQTYWVESASVTYTGGSWPLVHQDTRIGRPPRDGYLLHMEASGGQFNPGGLQLDLSHFIVDAFYAVDAALSITGASSGSDGMTLEREDVAISFKVRCANVGTPPAAGAPVFERRCRSIAGVYLVSSPNYNSAVATCYYILSGSLTSTTALALQPGGNLNEAPGWQQGDDITGPTPPAWTSVGINLWETTVTVPAPSDQFDQDIATAVTATGTTAGSIGTAFSSSSGRHEFRCVRIGGIDLQPGF